MNGIKYLIERNGNFHYCRRVPLEFAEIEPRKYIRTSLKTNILAEAIPRLAQIDKETEKYFNSLHLGGGELERLKFREAVKRARFFGLSYRSVETIAKGPLEDIQNRLKLADKNSDRTDVEAILGGADKPSPRLSNCLSTYFEIQKSTTLDKSSDQIRRWKNPRIKAIRNFIHVVGDLEIGNITRDEALTFRDYWLERIQDEDLTGNSANKDFGHLQKIIRLVCEHFRIEYHPAFSGLRFPENQKTQRLPFETDFILNNLIADDVLLGMSEAGRSLIRIMANTGARPSEIVGTIDEDWHLDHEIPYIHIKKNSFRALKTRNSEREIPLVGVSLKAAQNGAIELFREHRARSLNLTNAIGKYFRENKTLPSEQYTLYSLRHSFSDRLVDNDAPERVKAELMGHTYSKPTYGKGQALEKRLEWLEKSSVDS